MNTPCPACRHPVSAPKSAVGTRVTCDACAHGFFFADTWHAGQRFVVYDLETTGLTPGSDEIIQVAAMRFTAGRLCPGDTFASFARPRRPISSFIEQYTGITNAHVAGAERPEVVVARFAAWVGDATLIAHNGLRFDSKFLIETCRRHGLPSRDVASIDSIHLSKMLFGSARGTGHSLDAVMSRLRVDVRGVRRHDARGDVEILGRVVARLWQELGLDASFNGVRRHAAALPAIQGAA